VNDSCAECDDGFFGSSCESECHCEKEEVCAKDSGACPGFCAAGWNGTACQTGASIVYLKKTNIHNHCITLATVCLLIFSNVLIS